MIAVDANILLRYLLRDQPEQAQAAQALLDGLTADEPGFICREVVLETVWVMQRTYKLPRRAVAVALLELMARENLVFEAANDTARALLLYRRTNADFSDLLILAAARRAGANPLYTFDQRLARAEGAALAGA